MKALHMISFLLLIVGGLNWGLIALFNLDLVQAIFGGFPMAAKLVYVAVGASAAYIGVTHMADCKMCAKK